MKKAFFTTLLLLSALSLAVAQEYDIKLNLQPNQKVPIRSVTSVKQQITIPGQGTQDVNAITTSEVAFYVTEIKGENYIINGIVNKMEVETESMGQKMTISGADKEENQYNKQLRAVTNKVFVAEITPRFELVGEVKALNDDMTSEDAKMAFETLKATFSETYPKTPIKKGDTWEASIPEQNTQVKTTLTEVTEDSYLFDSKIVLDGEIEGIKLTGKGTRNYEVNRALGVPIYGLTTLPAEGSLVSPMGKVTLKVDTIVSFELMI